MKNDWKECKHILCVRADNMGDVLMSIPAIRALKETFGSKITLLTSSLAAGICPFLPEVDEVITFDLPWVKVSESGNSEEVFKLVNKLTDQHFDAAVIFTVYSQNPLPAAMLTYLAKIPRRLAYCRENPYELLTHWVPDEEPYTFIRHQVRRDLELVAAAGATTANEEVSVSIKKGAWQKARHKLRKEGVEPEKPWIVLHAGVSEKKREYPFDHWVELARQLANELNFQILFTGSAKEKTLTDALAGEAGAGSFSIAGLLSIGEFISLIRESPLFVSVNTGPVHIAAATRTPVIVLYALTNPQHLPWKVRGKALYYDVPLNQRSRNAVIRFVHDHVFYPDNPMIKPDEIITAAKEILSGKPLFFPELMPLRKSQ